MSEIDPQRRKVVALCAAVACMTPGVVALSRGHHILAGAAIVLQVVTLVYAIAELTKLKRQG